MNSKTDRHSKARILLVDDDADLLHLIGVRLKANDYDVCAVSSGDKALAQLTTFKPHVVVTDMMMPGMDGMGLFNEIQRRFANLPVIVLTAHGTIPDAVAATQEGVFSYLAKPFKAEALLNSLEKALLQSHPTSSQGDTDTDEEDWCAEIITQSPLMEALLQHAKVAAMSDVSILIQSQTGTGKELLASAIHKASERCDKPFMAFNCAAIPEALIETELFGHTAGAFTGASREHVGLFQAANQGTIFLDEVGDMPMAAQAKLLRVLEQREVRPVGATKTIPIDVRILSATHYDLAEKVADGSFREDLYYRLNVITLELPPLKDRNEDILLLANHFCNSLAAKHKRKIKGLSPEAAELLIRASWPGNVRQLYNVIEQCVVMASTPVISRSLVERSLRFKTESLLSLNEARERFEQDYLVRLLNLAEGNITLAARLAGRNRSEFYNLLKRHGLEPAQFRKPTEQ